MFKKYFLLALRGISRNRSYSFINILGFALGLYVCIIISLYVLDDLTFDHQFEEPENIYRIVSNDNSKDWISAVTVGPLYGFLEENVPEVVAATRIGRYGVRLLRNDIEQPDSMAIFRRALLTDSDYFRVFRPEIISGEKENPLSDPNAVYLTEATAEAIYGDEDPVGKSIEISFIENGYVAGIVKEPPLNTHMRYGVIITMDPSFNPLWWDSWENLTLTGYVRVQDNIDVKSMEQKIVDVARQNGMTTMFTPVMQPLLEMHLKSSELRYDAFNLNKSDASIPYSLIIIAILVLIVASINFINLSTAKSSNRGKEIGVRKVLGADKFQLSMQFLTESILYTILAMIIALGAVEISLSWLQPFLNKPLEFNIIQNPFTIPFAMLAAIFIGVISGLYPSMVLSSFKPISTLKGEFKSGKKGIVMRRILVIGQFSISIALILAVLVVISQLKYMQKINLGYNKESVLVIRTRDVRIDLESDIFKERVMELPAVSNSARLRQLPGNTLPTAEVYFDYRTDEIGIMTDEIFVDENFIDALDVDLITGRNFIRGSQADSASSILMNETAFKMTGWDNIDGHKIIWVPADGVDVELNVIGVIKDIHLGEAKNVIEPMIIHYNPRSDFLLVRTNDIELAASQIELVSNEFLPERDFDYFPLNDIFMMQFREEDSFAQKIAVFAIIAILIACLGLFALAAFITEKRTREIGIRKVLGSPIWSIVVLLTSDFIKWVLIANLIAWPLAWYAMSAWLQNFAYRTPLNPLLFVVAGFAALIIAIITVGFHTLKAANQNPANIMKYE
ncbi:MAG: ABC transporter permease [Candidatus Stygibacter australis]|nr:ABC transporter permease [Candidatus Stygibacter australis]MDP8322747.1 ABC transporter permease [Candidatus Stygibacter australis]